MTGGRIIAVDIHDHKLEFAYKFGATDVVNAREVNAVQAIRDLTGGGVDMSLDTFGSPMTTADAVASLRKGGTTVLVGLAPMGETAPIDMVDMVRNQKTSGRKLLRLGEPPRDLRQAGRLLPARSAGH